MTAKYFAILTNQGAARLANAAALGTKLNLTQMAVGDANGTLPTPDPAQTKLINQKRIAPINLLTIDPANTSQIIAEQIIPENEGGFWIREIGLYDDDGILIAVANCPETYKPQLQEGSGRTQTIRMILIVSGTSAITLKIDPAVVLATRQYVDDKIIEVKGYADDLMKKHVDHENPHKQYPLTANALKEMVDAGLADEVLANLGLPDAIPGRFLRRRFITSSGSYKPSGDVKKIRVRVIGGGGGGGAAGQTNSGYTAIGGGGGAGGCSERIISVDANFQAVNVTIGAGGVPGGQSGYSGGAGGVTNFGSLCSATGGDGGAGTAATNNTSYIMSGGAGGLGAGGEINAYGSPGSVAIMPAVNGGISGGGGASAISSGPGGRVGNSGGNDGVYGSGGSGGISQGAASTQYGGRGGAGIVIVEEYS